jgi:uncharacterized repeat protein (TIGR01451 family)
VRSAVWRGAAPLAGFALLMAACQGDGVLSPTPLSVPSAFEIIESNPPGVIDGQVWLCLDGPAGSGSFSVSQAPYPGGTPGTLTAGASPTVDAGECIQVWGKDVPFPGPPETDTANAVTITQTSVIPGSTFEMITAESESTNPPPVVIGQTVTFKVNYFHGAIAVYRNGECPPGSHVENNQCVPDDPRLTITKTADQASVTAGSTIGFRIDVASTGNTAATGVTVSDALPTGTGISWSIDAATSNAGCTIASNNLSCSFGDLAPGATRTVHVTSPTEYNSCGTYTNVASVGATNHATVSSGASVDVTGCVVLVGDGRVTGGGSIFGTVNGKPNTRVTHGFELRCDANDTRQSLEINWDGGNNFHLEKLINSVTCFDDPQSNPPPPPGTEIDTYAGTTLFNGQAGYHGYGYAVGTGICNKIPATIYFILVDNGEPGTGDISEYHIVGGCTIDVGPANLIKGNHQFHK